MPLRRPTSPDTRSETRDGSVGARAEHAGARAGFVAAIVATVVMLPLSIAMLVQLVVPVRGPEPVAWIVVLAVLLHAASLLGPRHPRTGFVAGALVMLALALIAMPGMSTAALLPSAVAFLVLESQAAASLPWREAFAALAVGIVGALIITTMDAVRGAAPDLVVLGFEAVALSAVVAAAWALGREARRRRRAAAERERRQVASALRAERERISRDLHDVVSHALTVMIAQTEAARIRVGDTAAAADLERVAETGRTAMQGLRGMLRVLDSGTDPASTGPMPGRVADPAPGRVADPAPGRVADPVPGRLADPVPGRLADPVPGRLTHPAGAGAGAVLLPSPTLRGLPDLVAQARTAQHRVEFRIAGAPRTLPPDAELALYRAAQEGITNAIRHVRPPVVIEVTLAWRPGDVELTVTDDGGVGPAEAAGSGTGLIAMAERLRQSGGRLDIRRDGGWTLQATIPTEAMR